MSDDHVHDIDGLQITASEIGEPSTFLASDRGKAWFEKLMGGVYFTAYYLDRGDSLDKKTANKLARDLIDAKRSGSEPFEVLEALFGHGSCAEDDYRESGTERRHRETVEELAEALAEYADDNGIALPEIDVEAWCEAIQEMAIEHMYGDDDSSVTDMVPSYERAEIVVRFTPDGVDDTIYSNQSWPSWRELCIDQALQRTLASLGYSIEDYRRATGNKTQSSDLARGLRRRARPIASLSEIERIVGEACAQSFSIVLYAIVPVKDLIELDLAKPFVLSQFAIAAYNHNSGTFFELSKKEAITIAPGEGRIEGIFGYSPEDICGLYRPPFYAEIKNVTVAPNLGLGSSDLNACAANDPSFISRAA